MVKGLDTFQKYFADYEEQYVLIGGAACDILFESNEVNFRATRDLDMVLIVEALTPEFGEKFWRFIVDGKYRNKATNGSNPQFYRFNKPEDDNFPKMIELFCRSDFKLKNAKGIACRSEVIKKKLLNLYPEFRQKTFTAPSGVDESIIRENLQPLHSPVKVLTCANFKKRKNIDKVILALKNLEGFELTVIGDGSLRKNLEKLDTNVNFTGALPHNEVIAKMRDSDIFILPSTGETFGMVYLEAMACGCITIATKDDGVDGIIKNQENGFLTIPISTEIRKLLQFIKSMEDDRLKVLRYNSFSTIQTYTKTRCCEHYLQQIFKIL